MENRYIWKNKKNGLYLYSWLYNTDGKNDPIYIGVPETKFSKNHVEQLNNADDWEAVLPPAEYEYFIYMHDAVGQMLVLTTSSTNLSAFHPPAAPNYKLNTYVSEKEILKFMVYCEPLIFDSHFKTDKKMDKSPGYIFVGKRVKEGAKPQ